MSKIHNLLVSTKFWRYPLIISFFFVAVGFCILPQGVWSHLSTVIGVAFTLLGVWFTLKIYEIGAEFNLQLERIVKAVQTVSLASLKLQYLDNLRNLFESAEENSSAQKYWHFIWRFESFDQLSLHLQPVGSGRVRIQIVGTNNDPLHIGYEGKENQIYTVKVIDVNDTNLYAINDQAYCTNMNGKSYISKDVNEIELLQPTHEFLIVGLGRMDVRTVGVGVPQFKRIKDVDKI